MSLNESEKTVKLNPFALRCHPSGKWSIMRNGQGEWDKFSDIVHYFYGVKEDEDFVEGQRRKSGTNVAS
eukprot:1557244-Karenia_brevis.AAC.1